MKAKGIARWVLSIGLLAFASGLSLKEVRLTQESGGAVISLSTLDAFPVASALMVFQGALVLVSLLIPVKPAKFLSLVAIPLMIWHLWQVVTSIEASLTLATFSKISELTGVSGTALIETQTESALWVLYPLAIALNVAMVAWFGFSRQQFHQRTTDSVRDTAEDLWEAQRKD